MQSVVTIDSGDILNWHSADHHLRIFAGPGAGKTHFLVQNMRAMAERGLVDASEGRRILCITYTNAAANEISHRLGASADCAHVSTIHSFVSREIIARHQVECRAILEEDFGAKIPEGVAIRGQREGFPLVTKRQKQALFERLKSDGSKAPAALSDQDLKKIQVDIAAYVDEGRKSIAGNAAATGLREAAVKRALWETAGVLTFDEILYVGWRLIEGCERIRNEVVAAYPYIFVDEFQDTNPIQALMVKELGQTGSVVGVIGDIAQSIYSFQGARPEMFSGFRVPGGRQTRDYRILGNRRSSGNIVAFANCLRQNDQLVQRAASPDPGPEVVLLAGAGEERRRTVERLVAEGAVVLTRTWAQAFAHLPGVSAFQAGALRRLYGYYFPYDIDFKSEVERGGSLRWARAYKLLSDMERGLAEGDGAACLDALADYARIRGERPSGNALTRSALALAELTFAGLPEDALAQNLARSLSRNLRRGEFADLAAACFGEGEVLVDVSASARLADILEVLEWSSVRRLYTHLFCDEPSVTTAHQSKGREWDTVIVDVVPTAHDNTTVAKMFRKLDIAGGSAQGEFTRLFYVACTRARKRLYVCVDNNAEVKGAISSALDRYAAGAGTALGYRIVEDSSTAEKRTEAAKSVALPPVSAAFEEEYGGAMASMAGAAPQGRPARRGAPSQPADDRVIDVPDGAFEDLPVSSLNLSARSRRILQREGFEYVQDLDGVTFEELCSLPHSGPIAAEEIFAAVAELQKTGL